MENETDRTLFHRINGPPPPLSRRLLRIVVIAFVTFLAFYLGYRWLR